MQKYFDPLQTYNCLICYKTGPPSNQVTSLTFQLLSQQNVSMQMKKISLQISGCEEDAYEDIIVVDTRS